MTADGGKDVEKKKHSSIVGGIANWYNHYGKQWCGSSEKLDIVLAEDTAILLLAIYPKDTTTYNQNTCSTMFTTASFIIARNCKETRCLFNRRMDTEMWFIYTMVHYSPVKNKSIKILGKYPRNYSHIK